MFEGRAVIRKSEVIVVIPQFCGENKESNLVKVKKMLEDLIAGDIKMQDIEKASDFLFKLTIT